MYNIWYIQLKGQYWLQEWERIIGYYSTKQLADEQAKEMKASVGACEWLNVRCVTVLEPSDGQEPKEVRRADKRPLRACSTCGVATPETYCDVCA